MKKNSKNKKANYKKITNPLLKESEFVAPLTYCYNYQILKKKKQRQLRVNFCPKFWDHPSHKETYDNVSKIEKSMMYLKFSIENCGIFNKIINVSSLTFACQQSFWRELHDTYIGPNYFNQRFKWSDFR